MLCRMIPAMCLLWSACQSTLAQTPDVVASGDTRPEACPVDPRGRPEQNLVKVDYARYYVWYADDLWHVRTAAKRLTRFSGSIRLTSGTFGRLRPVGLEAKARNPDKWGVNAERNEVRFDIHTVGSFDGFDFDVRDGADGRIEYDLKMGQEARNMPKRVFVGPDAGHPDHSSFSLPIAPTARAAADT